MNTPNSTINHDLTLPRELRAILRIMTVDDQLKVKALPHVNVERQSVNWTGIWQNDFGGGHSAALLFAQALWFDRVETKADPFDRAFAMDRDLQIACIEALAI